MLQVSGRTGAVLLCLCVFPPAVRGEDPNQSATVPQPPVAPPAPGQPITLKERFHIAVSLTFYPTQILGTGFSAAINQLQHDPPQWPQGMKGFYSRWGYQFAQNIVSHGISFGVGAALNEDPRWYASGSKDFWARMEYAAYHTFRIWKTDGRPAFAFSRVASDYGTAFIAAQYPSRQGTLSTAAVNGTIAMATGIGTNMLREFWPDIRTRILGKIIKHLPGHGAGTPQQ